jgi:hypothetical protein
MLYALINSTGIHRLEVEQKLELSNLQNLVGIQGSDALIEYVSHQFFDPNIDLICDEEFLIKELPLTCITPRNIALCGQVIAAACAANGDTVGLSEEQFQIVCDRLTVVAVS